MNSLFINEKVSYFLNIAVLSLAFSIFTLWKPDYLIYGLVTFVYGLTGHVMSVAFDHFVDNKPTAKAKKTLAIIELLLFVAWIISVLTIAL